MYTGDDKSKSIIRAILLVLKLVRERIDSSLVELNRLHLCILMGKLAVYPDIRKPTDLTVPRIVQSVLQETRTLHRDLKHVK